MASSTRARPHGHRRLGGDGAAEDPASDAAVTSMPDQLAWRAHALRDARALRPYAA